MKPISRWGAPNSGCMNFRPKLPNIIRSSQSHCHQPAWRAKVTAPQSVVAAQISAIRKRNRFCIQCRKRILLHGKVAGPSKSMDSPKALNDFDFMVSDWTGSATIGKREYSNRLVRYTATVRWTEQDGLGAWLTKQCAIWLNLQV